MFIFNYFIKNNDLYKLDNLESRKVYFTKEELKNPNSKTKEKMEFLKKNKNLIPWIV